MKAWITSTLAEACDMYQPTTITAKEMVADGAYPVYGANGVIGRYDRFNHEEPQLLITCRGATCGSVNISEAKSWITGNSMVIRPKRQSLDIRFLEYLFRGGIDLSKAITGAAQPQITRANLNPIIFIYPESLDEQRRIVAILDEAFEAIATAKANAEKNLRNAYALFETSLQSVFAQRGNGWVDTKLEEVCGFQNGFAFKSSTFKPAGAPIIRISNIQNGRIYTKNRLVFFDPNDYRENLDRYRVVEGDLMIAMSGATTGKIGFNTESTIFYLNQRVGKFEPSKKLNKLFLYHFLSTKVEENLRISAGAAQPNLSTEQIKGFVLPLPPIDEQAHIVAALETLAEETQCLVTLYERKLAALDELKKSLLHQAFSGQL
ncbi:restriction endonuclease subunit S [Leptothrix ochracea]|uniref:restriction endonuclease subunit S n=1 Tax=Leptothrix ochracea TaxID=735331 RepID=UPI0034E22875